MNKTNSYIVVQFTGKAQLMTSWLKHIRSC